MKKTLQIVALGGGCHWCTEAVFQALKGVEKVEQGFAASGGHYTNFSEAVIVHFNSKIIFLKRIIEIHLHTHKSTSNHSLRSKYRSAIYYNNKKQKEKVLQILQKLQEQFDDKIITQVLEFTAFRPSKDEYIDYYNQNPQRPFCKKYIEPKLNLLFQKFPLDVSENKDF